MNNYYVTSKSKHWKCFAFLILLFVISLQASAQTTVIGTISDVNGPVPGVNINLKGSQNGVSTGFDGKYSISNVPSNGVLVVSFVGYKTKEISVNGKTSINVVIEDESNSLKEIVVIGYGAVRKEAVTGSVSTIGGKQLNEFASGNVTQALQGRLPGIELTQTSTKPGASMQIRIRGTRSLTASNDPLIVLDGVPFAGEIGDINPVDIKSLDILKDASATAIYGSRGANGVVLITTNKGTKGQKAKFTYNSFGGVKTVFGEYDMMNGDKFGKLRSYAGLYSNNKKDEISGYNTDWQHLLYNSGQITSHDIGVSGGTENGSYTGGLGYYKEESVLPGQDYERFSLRASIDQQIGKLFRVGFTTNNNYAVKNGDNIGPGAALAMSPLVNPYDANGKLKRVVNQANTDDKWVYTRESINALGEGYVNLNKAFSTYNNIFAEIKIPGVDGLKYRINSGLNFRIANNGYYEGEGVFDTNATTKSNARINNSLSTQWLVENLLTYDKTFAKKHTFNFIGLYSNESYIGNASEISREGITSDAFQFYNLGQSGEPVTIDPNKQDYTKWGLRSYMARLMYSYDNRYFISGTVRSDGSSRLSEGNKWVTYPAVSVGWTISNESFMKDISWLSSLKLRAGYGETSNQSVDPYATLGALGTRTYNFGNTYQTGIYLKELPNPILGWEYSKTMNYGVDFGFFNSRLTGTVEYYNTKTENLLQRVSLPTTSGVSGYTANVGSTENKGYEISLNGIIIDNPNGLTWTVGFNLYSNKNQITSLSSGKDKDETNLWFVGHNVASLYDYEKIGLWQVGDAFMDKYETGSTDPNASKTIVGSIKVKYTGDFNPDGSPTRKINPSDRQVIDTDPDFQGGFSTNLTYKGFDFNAVGAFKSGGVLVSTIYGSAGYLNLLNGRGSNVDVDYWTPTNTGADFPNPKGIRSGDNPNYMSTMGYFDGSYLKIRSLTLGYTLQQDFMKKVGVDKMRIYTSVQNPFVFFSPYHDMSGMDPETNSLGDENQAVNSYPKRILVIGTNTPSTRNFLFGLNLTF